MIVVSLSRNYKKLVSFQLIIKIKKQQISKQIFVRLFSKVLENQLQQIQAGYDVIMTSYSRHTTVNIDEAVL